MQQHCGEYRFDVCFSTGLNCSIRIVNSCNYHDHVTCDERNTLNDQHCSPGNFQGQRKMSQLQTEDEHLCGGKYWELVERNNCKGLWLTYYRDLVTRVSSLDNLEWVEIDFRRSSVSTRSTHIDYAWTTHTQLVMYKTKFLTMVKTCGYTLRASSRRPSFTFLPLIAYTRRIWNTEIHQLWPGHSASAIDQQYTNNRTDTNS